MSTPHLHMHTAITQARTFVSLLPIIKQAHPNISFWGQRYVHIIGYQGTWPIDALAGHILEMLRQNSVFNENERIVCNEIVGLINKSYEISDAQTEYLNYFTYLFCKLRDCWTESLDTYGPRFQWRNSRLDNSNLYEQMTRRNIERLQAKAAKKDQ